MSTKASRRPEHERNGIDQQSQSGDCVRWEAEPAAAIHCAMRLMRTFPQVKNGLLSEIGDGVPSPKADIRLGDVVVSRPGPRHRGVVYYDAGNLAEDGFEPEGYLDRPPLPLETPRPTLNEHWTRRYAVLGLSQKCGARASSFDDGPL